MWNLPPPTGFHGLRDNLPLTCYTQGLPHWRQDGATYFVTFRIQDSLPQSKLRELRLLKDEWRRRNRPPYCEEALRLLARDSMSRVERWLDQGMGRCVLRDGEFAELLVTALHQHDGKHYELGCYVVMPNHVHVVVRPSDPTEFPLEMILKHWKGSSACAINEKLKQTGALWQRESFDRIIRDAEHLFRVVQYIGRNPRLARLSHKDVRLWIRPTWVDSGWQFEPASGYHR